jgi:hypothetical protein
VARRRRDYQAEYERRNERARALGFANEVERRKAPRHPGSTADFGRLPEPARVSRRDALRVVRFARMAELPVEAAADELGVPVAVVRYWAPGALRPTRQGRTPVRAGDRLPRLRPLVFEGESETEFVIVRGSRKADDAVWVFDIQWRYGNNQADESELEQIRGLRFAGRTVESDPAQLSRVAAGGGFDPDDVYSALLA